VESPGKPPTPTIEISSDEDSTTNSSEAELLHDSCKAVGTPGPAYHKTVARQVLSPPKSQAVTDVIILDGPAERRRRVNEQRADQINSENSNSLPKPSINPISPASQKEKTRSTPEAASSPVRLSISPYATLPNVNAPQSQGGSSTQSHDSPEASKPPLSAGSKQAESDRLETDQRSEITDDDLVEDPDFTETPHALKPSNVPTSIRGGQDGSSHLKEDKSEASADEVAEDSDSSDDSQPGNVPASARNRQDDSTHLKAETENETTDEELEEDPDVRKPDTEDETTDEEVEQFSDAMQAQVDDQLLTQSFESSSSLEQQSSVPNISKVLTPVVKEAGLLQTHSSGRPSLRRMNLEAQRTKEANLEAAKARGLERARKIRAGAKPAGLLEESSAEATSSELSDTSSEYETDQGKPVANTRNKRSSADKAGENHDDLNNEDVEDMSQQLLVKNGDFNGPSLMTPVLKSPSKGPDLMLRTRSKLRQNKGKKDGKKSGKIGWAKLGKQFSASKHKSTG
jgi:hypothetical protein